MKKEATTTRTPKSTFLETDIEDSEAFGQPNPLGMRKHKKRINKFARQVKHPEPTQIKLFRFSLKHVKKTLRVPCYQEELLNLPDRFTRKLNAMQIDNDVETDEQVAQNEVRRCENWLKEAINNQEGL